LEKFQNSIEVLKHCGGIMGDVLGLINMVLVKNIDPDKLTNNQMTLARKMTHDAYLRVANQFGRLIEDLENDYTQG
jgi:hypothetical protein